MVKTTNNMPMEHGRISSSHGRTRNHAHFADFIPKGLPWLWTHAVINVRHFVKDYSLAVVLSLLFLLLVSIVGIVRMSQQASLADLLAGVTTITQDYDSLVSGDKADAPQRGDTSGDPGTTPAPAGSNTSFTLNSGGSTTNSTGGSTGDDGGGDTTPTPAPVFAAAIGTFQQDSSQLECGGLNQNKPNCSRRYTFSASVNTQNGPGTVNYGWRTNFSGGSEDSSFSAGGGTSSRTLQKSISIPCLSPGSYSMQFVILSPTQVQSSTLNISHNCTGI